MKKPDLKNGLASLVFLGLTYVIGSRALDTGSYWEYLGTLISLILAIKFIVQLFKHGKKV